LVEHSSQVVVEHLGETVDGQCHEVRGGFRLTSVFFVINVAGTSAGLAAAGGEVGQEPIHSLRVFAAVELVCHLLTAHPVEEDDVPSRIGVRVEGHPGAVFGGHPHDGLATLPAPIHCSS
jgi:hypothetical protein